VSAVALGHRHVFFLVDLTVIRNGLRNVVM